MYFFSQDSPRSHLVSISQTSSVISGIIKNWSKNNAAITGEETFSSHERAHSCEDASQEIQYVSDNTNAPT